MRKFVSLVVLFLSVSLFSSLSFAQSTQRDVAVGSSSAQSTPGASLSVVSVANSLGQWVGRTVQSPVAVVSSLASGIKTGYSDSSAQATQAAQSVPSNETASANPAVALREKLGSMFAMVQARGASASSQPVAIPQVVRPNHAVVIDRSDSPAAPATAAQVSYLPD